jgi:hypothetical protein
LSFQTKALPINPAPPVTTIILIAPVILISFFLVILNMDAVNKEKQ